MGIAPSENAPLVQFALERAAMIENDRQNTAIKRRRKWLLGVSASAVILAAVLAYYSITILFDESLYTNEGSFAYYLAVPDLIADAPRPGQIGEPRFYVSAGDGPKAPASAVSYRSNAKHEDVFRALEAYLRSEGLLRAGTLADVYPTGRALRHMHGEQAIIYKPKGRTRLQHVIVRVEEIEGTQSEISITATF